MDRADQRRRGSFSLMNCIALDTPKSVGGTDASRAALVTTTDAASSSKKLSAMKSPLHHTLKTRYA
jgi:hypothetical protein